MKGATAFTSCLHFQQLYGRDLGEQQAPGVAPAQVYLLQVLVEATLGKQVLLHLELFRQQWHLR